MTALTLIESKTLATAAASIEFTSIPQDGTDLYVLFSGRADTTESVTLSFNTGGTYAYQRLFGTGSITGSDTNGQFAASSSSQTSNTFGNGSIYIPNYTGSTAKSFSIDSVNENNATAAIQILLAGLWSETAAITTLKITAFSTFTLLAGTTASLYKITKGSDGIVTTS
jgi:hypothetical protein